MLQSLGEYLLLHMLTSWCLLLTCAAERCCPNQPCETPMLLLSAYLPVVHRTEGSCSKHSSVRRPDAVCIVARYVPDLALCEMCYCCLRLYCAPMLLVCGDPCDVWCCCLYGHSALTTTFVLRTPVRLSVFKPFSHSLTVELSLAAYMPFPFSSTHMPLSLMLFLLSCLLLWCIVYTVIITIVASFVAVVVMIINNNFTPCY